MGSGLSAKCHMTALIFSFLFIAIFKGITGSYGTDYKRGLRHFWKINLWMDVSSSRFHVLCVAVKGAPLPSLANKIEIARRDQPENFSTYGNKEAV